jgi:hypothetical protein
VDRQLTNWKRLLSANEMTFDGLGIDRFKTYIPNLKVFNSGMTEESCSGKKKVDFLRSTILLPHVSELERSNYLAFAKELLEKLENVK